MRAAGVTAKERMLVASLNTQLSFRVATVTSGTRSGCQSVSEWQVHAPLRIGPLEDVDRYLGDWQPYADHLELHAEPAIQ